jgi:hypothetical protein
LRVAWPIAFLIVAFPAMRVDAGVIDFTFCETGSSVCSHRSSHLAADLGTDVHALLLVETPSLSLKTFRRQFRSVDKWDSEGLGLVVVVASVEAESKGGYHTDVVTARRLAGAKPTFRITLMDGAGVVRRSWSRFVTEAEVRREIPGGAKHSAF